jgi:protoporphyrinogen oxidase
MRKTAIIIGAGPAGLTAALELLRRTDIQPIVLEATNEIGGISRTIRYKDNRMDIGGHRFFSKSDRVMQWWMDMMPVERADDSVENHQIHYQGKTRTVATKPVATAATFKGVVAGSNGNGATSHQSAVMVEELEDVIVEDELIDTELPAHDPDRVMLIRPRKSRIYYLRKFFDYPITLTGNTLKNLGAIRTVRVGTSYILSRFRQIAPETSLEQFLINRFGRELYLTFFKSYTEKVWGTPCDQISAEWGAQRIKGLSLSTAIRHFVKKLFTKPTSSAKDDIAQKGTDTSLIERFMYPKLGPGQLWEYAAAETLQRGGEIRMERTVVGLGCDGDRVRTVEVTDKHGHHETFRADYVFSTMPMRDLVRAMDTTKPAHITEISEGLQYRDFITVGLLVDRLAVTEANGGLLKDTWIYVQEPDVLLGRLQIFNNWSPHLVSDPTKVWIGLEYFCYDTDDLWKMEDEALKKFAIAEVASIGILNAADVRDAHVVRVPKTYPAYFGTYERFGELREWVNGFDNLFLVGRNGMHKYNNQDHSMLTAMAVVDGLCAGHVDKAALWNINTEQDYQEEKHKA